jgi:hypothetical protein
LKTIENKVIRIHHFTSGCVVDNRAFGKNNKTFTNHNQGSMKNPPMNSVARINYMLSGAMKYDDEIMK